MKRAELFQSHSARLDEDGGIDIDFKKIAYNVRRHWYVVALSVFSMLLLAFVNNRYATRIYPVSASLIVKESGDISGAELLYNNPLLNFKRNYLNELYIIKSSPLIKQVIEDLNFDIAFYREGNVLTTQLYEEIPIEAHADRLLATKPTQFNFTVLSNEEFLLEKRGDDESAVSGKFRFNDSISFAGFVGVYTIKDSASLGLFVNEPLVFAYTPSDILADEYTNSLNVSWAEEGAGVVNLSINGANAGKLKDFLAGLILKYQNSDLENKNVAASRTVFFISDQLERISDSLRQVELQLQVFKNENVVTDLTGESLRLYKKAEEIEGERAEIIINQNYYKYLIEYIQKNDDLHQIILPSSVGISDQILTDLVSRMNELQLDIKMSNRASNPLIGDGMRRVEEMKRDIIETVKNEKSIDQIKLDFLSRQINDIEKQLSRLPKAERALVEIQRNYALQENLYIFLLQKRSEAAISKASNTSDIVMVNPPKAGSAIYPRAILNYLLAGVIGLLLPIGFFVLVDLTNTRVQSRENIEKITSIPFLGGIGHKTQGTNLTVLSQPKSVLAESFRALRSNLNYFIGNREKGIFLVTSSISGEGKSFTTINLAAVMSLSSKRTLIIGADLRRPKMFDDFNLTNDVGLSNYLAGLVDFNQTVQKTPHENLDFVSGGPVPPNPSELLISERMSSFLDQAKLIYDFIIIDTPPLAIVTDAFVLSSYADHILFLVRQNYTPKEFLKAVEDFYSTGKLKNISIVLNDIRDSGPGYGYAYNYGYGYAYGKAGSEYYEES